MLEGILNNLENEIKVSERELLDLINMRYSELQNGEILLGEYLGTIDKFVKSLQRHYYDE